MFYEKVQSLCAEHGVKISTIVKELGISTSMPTQWKNGAIPKLSTVQKIADYFGVPMDYFVADQSSNRVENVSNSAIIQGNTGNHVSATVGQPVQNDINPLEAELLRIFRNLDMRSQTAVLTCAYEQEERQTKK